MSDYDRNYSAYSWKQYNIVVGTMPTTFPILPPRLVLISTKAYFSPQKTLSYLDEMLDTASGILPLPTDDLLLALIPDFITLYPCVQRINSVQPSSQLLLGAQDCHTSASYGAYTGSVVPALLRDIGGITIVELGHAERRRDFYETDATTASKVAAATECGLVPLVCVGEKAVPPSGGPMSMAIGNAMREIGPQVQSALTAVPKNAPVIIAYEPVWAIGAAKPATVDFVGPVVVAIRNEIAEIERCHGREQGITRVVYGGSAGPGLWSEGGLSNYVDGMFLGRFSHEITGVKKVVDEVLSTMGVRR